MDAIMSALLSLPVVLSATVFIAVIIALSLATLAVTRKLVGHYATKETHDLAGSVLFRIAALHGLVLALVFAQELDSIKDVHNTSAREAAMVGDIYHDLKRYGGDDADSIRTELVSYAKVVVEKEWPALAGPRSLSIQAWKSWETTYEAILELTPETKRQERLLNFMLSDIRELSELREARENAALSETSTLFLVAAISGIVLISAAYFTWQITPVNLGLITAFAAYTGLILYFVIAFSNPYLAPGNAKPFGMERFLASAEN
ncbi:DUF4239 domain-containing protein [Ahrensia sp. R2A130]|uniref:bestrophin-like domain n=1 Tax=Ahrensia sp. R2A130 TaxID=744979 RepID=UPI0001E0BC43|nr:DUF4239 domain-containing protein [Ahrensia sp. R2A130]EFL90757.1 hypothetical protein R2A130_0840 [Ahrensia sp. R2A130]